tara:strand:+ start:261 stop:884 length:624 start_codon:yes stop_codon:yes gene_type:complete
MSKEEKSSKESREEKVEESELEEEIKEPKEENKKDSEDQEENLGKEEKFLASLQSSRRGIVDPSLRPVAEVREESLENMALMQPLSDQRKKELETEQDTGYTANNNNKPKETYTSSSLDTNPQYTSSEFQQTSITQSSEPQVGFNVVPEDNQVKMARRDFEHSARSGARDMVGDTKREYDVVSMEEAMKDPLNPSKNKDKNKPYNPF